MSQIDPRMIQGDPKGFEQWPKPRKEGPKVTEEIRRSGDDPTRSEIQEYHLRLSLNLVSRRAIPECARERKSLTV